MQDIKLTVCGGVDINVNFGFKADPGGQLPSGYEALEDAIRSLMQSVVLESEPDLPDFTTALDYLDEELEDEPELMPCNGFLFYPFDVVLVVHSEYGVNAMTAEDSRKILDVFEGDELGCSFPLTDLGMTFKPDAVTTFGGRKYLVGPAVVFNTLGEYSFSLRGEEIHLVKRILEVHCETIIYNDRPVKALPL